jgi:hypothetical protein
MKKILNDPFSMGKIPQNAKSSYIYCNVPNEYQNVINYWLKINGNLKNAF